MDPAIEKFLSEQKEKKLKKNKTESERKKKTEEQIDKECSLEHWLVEASKKAGQMSLSTHVCKFSHPSAEKNKNGRTSPVIAGQPAKDNDLISKEQPEKDGYLVSGNVKNAKLDAYGNAAVLAVYKFLNLEMEKDGKTLLEHIESGEAMPPNVLGNVSTDAPYEKLREGILKIKKQTEPPTTSSKIKQVYFPVGESYHQLSLLTPSGLISSMKERIEKIHSGEENKEARKLHRDNEYSEKKDRQIYDLTIIGYGGTKSQNISVLNSRRGGKFYLLPSWPPRLENREVRLPKKDFFQECLWPKFYEKEFSNLHRILLDRRNNITIRQSRDEIILDIFYEILDRIVKIRRQGGPGWTGRENYKNLLEDQKHILDNIYEQKRKEDTENRELFLKETARWVVISYKKVLGKKALDLYDIEIRHFYDVLLKEGEGMEALL